MKPIENNLKLFLIDDDKNFLEIYKAILENEGFLVEVFFEPEKALENILKEKFSVVITDINMPGMSGLEILEKIREKDHNRPVIMITGQNDTKTYLKALNNQATYLLPKPIEVEQLILSIQQAIDRYQLYLRNIELLEELKEKNKLFKNNSQLLKKILDSLQSGIILLNQEKKIIFLNSITEKIFDLPSENILKENIFAIPINKILLSKLEKIFQEKIIEENFQINLENEESYLIKIKKVDNYFLIILENLSQIRTLEKKLAQKEQEAELAKFFSYLAHEIRNPLTGMETLTSYIMENNNITFEELKEIMIDFKREIERLVKLTKNISSISKDYSNYPQTPKTDTKILIEEIKKIIHSLEKTFSFKIKFNLEIKNEFTLLIPPDLIKQVLLNLIKNSFEAMKDQKDKSLQIIIYSQDNNGIIEIIDNGPGFLDIQNISKGIILSSKKEGSGFGIKISQKIIEDYQGKISYKNITNPRGSKVIIKLPIWKEN